MEIDPYFLEGLEHLEPEVSSHLKSFIRHPIFRNHRQQKRKKTRHLSGDRRQFLRQRKGWIFLQLEVESLYIPMGHLFL